MNAEVLKKLNVYLHFFLRNLFLHVSHLDVSH